MTLGSDSTYVTVGMAERW